MKQYNTNTISAFDAKTHFANLLKKVGEGERITILKHNTPVAMLVPIIGEKQSSASYIIDELENFSKGKLLANFTIKELINEGRR